MTKQIEPIIDCLLGSIPEYCQSFECSSYDYDKHVYELTDIETGTKYTLTLDVAKDGFMKMLQDLVDGNLPGLECSNCPLDPTEWDATAVDALIQYALLGELVYG